MKRFLNKLFKPRIEQWNLNKTIGWESDNETLSKAPILFLQLQFDSPPDSTMSKTCEELEKIIDEYLKEKRLGKLFTSELIDCNYTMLYVTSNYPQGVEAIRTVIESENLNQNYVIARRLYKSSSEWKYEILHPKQTSLRFRELE